MPVSDVEEHLERWLDAGVIHDTAAERIREFERQRTHEEPSAERPSAIEALLYLGVVVVSVGVFALFEQRWGELDSWARILALGVPTALALTLGAGLHSSAEGGLQRAGQLAWFVAVGLFAGTAAVVLHEYEPLGIGLEDDREGLLTTVGLAALLALILWVFSPKHPQLMALGVSLFALGQATGNWPDEFNEVLAGMLVFAFGVAGLALTEAGMIGPRLSGRLFFGILCAVGPYQAGFTGNGVPFELMVFGVAAALVALGVMRASFTLLAIGVIASFVGLVTFIFEHFEDRIGAPVALMISGGALIAGVLLLARFRSAEHIRRLR